jgi:hypothetical protein
VRARPAMYLLLRESESACKSAVFDRRSRLPGHVDIPRMCGADCNAAQLA